MKQLYGALLEAQKSLEGVEKKSTNQFARYDYVSAEDMVISAREALHRSGLVIGRKSWSIGDGKAKSTFFIAHPESGEEIAGDTEFPVVEKKGNPADKAAATALTTGLGYFLRDVLLLPRFNRGENMDHRDDRAQIVDEIESRLFKNHSA